MDTKTARVRALNDQLRQHLTGGMAVMTPGVAALGAAAVGRPHREPDRRLANQREVDTAMQHPGASILSGTWDRSAHAMEARILRPLLWFKFLEYHGEKIADSRFTAGHYYRKGALFDRSRSISKWILRRFPVTDGINLAAAISLLSLLIR